MHAFTFAFVKKQFDRRASIGSKVLLITEYKQISKQQLCISK